MAEKTPCEASAPKSVTPMGLGAIAVLVLLFLIASPFVYNKMRADYNARAHLFEVMQAAKMMEKNVESARASNKPLGAGPLDPVVRDVKSADLTPRGEIVIEVSDQVSPGGKLTFTWQPPPTEPRWKCRGQGFPSRLLPRECED